MLRVLLEPRGSNMLLAVSPLIHVLGVANISS